MQAVPLPKSDSAVKLTFDREHGLSLEAYLAFCREHPDLRVERTAGGEIIFMPPAGGESSNRSLKVAIQLAAWAESHGGQVFDSSVEFILRDGSALSPDASWLSDDALRSIPRQKRKQFLRVAPEFVVEVRSPSDRLKSAKEKMELWIANGVELAWLIDADRETVYVYRKRKPVRTVRGVSELTGEGPVAGFVLRMGPIWRGLG